MRRAVLLLACGFAAFFSIDAQATSAIVEGEVTPLRWAQEVEVCIVETQPTENCALPEADGSYVLRNAPSGPVRVEFSPSYRSHLLTQYYDNKSTLVEAAYLVLDARVPTQGIDADLDPGGAVTGVVTAEASGKPVPEVEVCAVSIAPPTVKSCEETNTSGEYEVHSLPTGTYRIGFWGHGKSAEYAPSYFRDKASFLEATEVAVTAGETTGGVDARLVEGGQIQGTVIAAAGGEFLERITVCLFAVTGSAVQRCVASEEGGIYSFEGLPDGSYQVGFSLDPTEIADGAVAGEEDDGYQAQYYPSMASRSEAQTLLLIAPQILGGIDAFLLTPPPAPLAIPPAAVAGPLGATPPTITEPTNAKLVKCKRGYIRKKVKSAERCVKKPAKRRKQKHHKRTGTGTG